ncbi:MAG: helix-turn-helix transcriptional regulator [Alphaproteobacteria bacterium]|nr:helix-turn-helix transcriptional regulator [Alphaproteobacteria bacterium]
MSNILEAIVDTQPSFNKGMGRPPILFSNADWQNIEKLCSLMCTADEIAFFLGISIDTLSRRITETYGCTFADYHKKHIVSAIISLRRAQWKNAMKGNATMQIWLGKQYLGQKNNMDLVVATSPMEGLKKAWACVEEDLK